jgi:protein involved in polysaccharide export with SLBB domain
VRVAPDGTAGVFWVTPVKLAGLTTEQAGRAVKDAYIHDFVEFGSWINVERIVTRVSGEGCIHLPYIGQVKIGGLTESQAILAIEKAYKNADPPEPAMRISLLRVAPDKPVGPGS